MDFKKYSLADLNWRAQVARYQTADNIRSFWQIFNSFVPFLTLWVAMFFAFQYSYLLTLALAVPAAGFTVRIFIILHDCGHGSFFKTRKANDILGMIAGIFTLTPYHYWKVSHNIHHASTGNLEARGIGDIYTMTVEEFQSLSKWGKFKYRLYRNPLVMFVVVPATLFTILYRIPFTRSKSLKKVYKSIHFTNLFLALFYGILGYWMGFGKLLMIQLPISIISSGAGVWLFYVQHQFENTYWSTEDSWDFTIASIRGSSFYRLPKILQWFTGNIGFHHIHHLSPKIPNYFLEKCHRENTIFKEANVLTIKSSLRSVFLTLWDEKEKRLISFRTFKKIYLQRNTAKLF